jgi:hypothetical protein
VLCETSIYPCSDHVAICGVAEADPHLFFRCSRGISAHAVSRAPSEASRRSLSPSVTAPSATERMHRRDRCRRRGPERSHREVDNVIAQARHVLDVVNSCTGFIPVHTHSVAQITPPLCTSSCCYGGATPRELPPKTDATPGSAAAAHWRWRWRRWRRWRRRGDHGCRLAAPAPGELGGEGQQEGGNENAPKQSTTPRTRRT